MKIKLRLLGLVCRLAFVFAVVPTALSVLSPAAQATTTADMVDSELKTLATKRDALGQEIETLSANLTCHAAKDCVALPYGNKPCGGPRKFIAASKRNPNFTSLKQKLNDFEEADTAVNKAAQMMSDCMALVQPAVACKAGKCRALPMAASEHQSP